MLRCDTQGAVDCSVCGSSGPPPLQEGGTLQLTRLRQKSCSQVKPNYN